MKLLSEIIKNNKPALAGWTSYIIEVSNGVYEITLKDKYGRTASNKDSYLERGIETSIQYALDIEKQVNTSWSEFLFKTFLIFLNETANDARYHDESFGSWLIKVGNKQLVFDGRDSWLYLQTFHDKDWIDDLIIKKDEIYSVKVILLLTFF